MTKEEVIKRLTEFNVDPRNTRLREYYDSDNMWKTLRIERDENKHSDFLAWILGKDATESNSFLHRFLNLLVLRAKNDTNSVPQIIQMDDDLRDSILMQKLKVRRVKEITREKTISSLSVIRYVDRIDIYMDCEIEGCPPYKRLEIIIENKVGASEGKTKEKTPPQPTKEENIYKDKLQTERYYYACSKDGNGNSLRKPPLNPGETQQLFVFLTPKEEEPKDKHFIKISYQDLVDYVLEPYFDQTQADENIVTTLKDYLRNLGNPINNKLIMATPASEKDLLIDFYKRNEDLFRSAIEAMIGDKNTSTEDGVYLTTISVALNENKSPKSFVINSNQNKKYSRYETLKQYICYKLGEQEIDKINQELEEMLDIARTTSSDKRIVSAEFQQSGRRKKDKNGKEYYDAYEIEHNGNKYYLSKEWGWNTGQYQFETIMIKINENDDNFQITPVS